MTATYKTYYNYENVERQDPAWYTTGDTHNYVATVVRDDGHGFTKAIRIYVDGIMRVNYKDKTITDGYGLLSAGINTDEDLSSPDLEWLNNSWYDLYDEDQQHGDADGWLDCVSHDLSDAIAQAQAILAEWQDLDASED